MPSELVSKTSSRGGDGKGVICIGTNGFNNAGIGTYIVDCFNYNYTKLVISSYIEKLQSDINYEIVVLFYLIVILIAIRLLIFYYGKARIHANINQKYYSGNT